MTLLIFARHGENLANITKEFSYKRIDYSLTPKGILQAQQAGSYLKSEAITAIYSSPLKRARETADIIAQFHVLPIHVMEEFRETNVGDLEALPPDEATWRIFMDIYCKWERGDYETPFPGGENRKELEERVTWGVKKVLQEHPEGTVVIVGHGGIFGMAVPHFCTNLSLEDLKKTPWPNAGISRCDLKIENNRVTGSCLEFGYNGFLSGKAAEVVDGIPAFLREEINQRE